MQEYTHHGLMFSYYSAKTRAYLNYKRIPYRESYDGKDINTRLKSIVGKVMIPMLESPGGEVWQDTTVIIDVMEQRHPDRPVMPADPLQMMLCRLSEFFFDELWISTAMNSRWNDLDSNAFVVREFGYHIGGSLGMQGEEAMKIGETVAGQMQSYLPRLGVGDAAGQQIASDLFAAVAMRLNDTVGKDRYALGAHPCLLDFSLFAAFYAHQYRDVGKAAIFLKTQTPNLAYYIDSLMSGQGIAADGELTIGDNLVDALSYIGPVAASFGGGLDVFTREFVKDKPAGTAIQGSADPFEVDVHGTPWQRGGSIFSAWKAQRLRDAYQLASDTDADRTKELASRLEMQDWLAADPGYRLDWSDYRIVVA